MSDPPSAKSNSRPPSSKAPSEAPREPVDPSKADSDAPPPGSKRPSVSGSAAKESNPPASRKNSITSNVPRGSDSATRPRSTSPKPASARGDGDVSAENPSPFPASPKARSSFSSSPSPSSHDRSPGYRSAGSYTDHSSRSPSPALKSRDGDAPSDGRQSLAQPTAPPPADAVRVQLPPAVAAELRRKQRAAAAGVAGASARPSTVPTPSRRLGPKLAPVVDTYEWVPMCVIRRRMEPLKRLLTGRPKPELADLTISLPVPRGGTYPTTSPLYFGQLIAETTATGKASVEGSLMHYAAASGDVEVALLLARAVGPTTEWPDDSAGRTVLHAAAWGGRVQIIDSILAAAEARGGPPAVVSCIYGADARGATPRDMALSRSHTAAVARMDAMLNSISAASERFRAASSAAMQRRAADRVAKAELRSAARAVREAVAVGDHPQMCAALRSAAPEWADSSGLAAATACGLSLSGRGGVHAAAAILEAAPVGSPAHALLKRRIPRNAAASVGGTFAIAVAGRAPTTANAAPSPAALFLLRPPPGGLRERIARAPLTPAPQPQRSRASSDRQTTAKAARPPLTEKNNVPPVLAVVGYSAFARSESISFPYKTELTVEFGHATSDDAANRPLHCCVVRSAPADSGLLVGDVLVAISAAPAGLPPGRVESTAGADVLSAQAVVSSVDDAAHMMGDSARLVRAVEQHARDSAASGRPGVMLGLVRSEGVSARRAVVIIGVPIENANTATSSTSKSMHSTAVTTTDAEDDEEDAYATTASDTSSEMW